MRAFTYCSRCIKVAVLVLLASADLAESAGQLSIQLLHYSSGGVTASGAKCHPDTPCSPQFRVTVEREIKGGELLLDYTQSGYYGNQDSVNFVHTFWDLPNPFDVKLNYDDNDGGLWLEVKVTDKSGAAMSHFTADLQASGTKAKQIELTSANNHSLTLKYWFSCSVSYYGDMCNKLCRDSDDDQYGHGWCDAKGNRFCRFGWIDPSTDCKKRHPCRTCVCQNGGTCVPLGANGYKCQCPTGFDGENCENCHLHPSLCGKNSNTANGCDIQLKSDASIIGVSTGTLASAFFVLSAVVLFSHS